MSRYTARNPKELRSVAKTIARSLKGGDIVALYGRMGAGKTTLAHLIGKFLGCQKTINSPSYVFVKRYEVKNHPTIKCVRHIDAWRLPRPQETESIIDREDIGSPDSLTLIEWPEKIKLAKKPTVTVKITKDQESDTRTITLQSAQPLERGL